MLPGAFLSFGSAPLLAPTFLFHPALPLKHVNGILHVRAPSDPALALDLAPRWEWSWPPGRIVHRDDPLLMGGILVELEGDES